MKDWLQIWSRVSGRQYSSVNGAELKDLSNNRLKKCDINTSIFEANLAECEGLNNKFTNDLDFNEKKNAIINRLFEQRKKGHSLRQPKCLFMLLMLGFMILATGFLITFLNPYDFFFKQKCVLQDGGEIYELWRKPEVNLYIRIFIFNVTNADEFMSGKDSKLKLVEVGPYVYQERLEHNVTKFNDNGTLSAIPVHPVTWVEELSEGHKEDDILYVPHIALLSIANVVSKQGFITRIGINNLITMTNSKPLVKMTAREFMMGYESKLLSFGNTFLPSWIYFDKLGLIDRMYDFNGDYETIFTGETEVENSGLIDTYKGSTDLPHWEGKHCSNVQYASDGIKYSSHLKMNKSILFYRKSLCRAVPMIPVRESLKGGLKAYMYTFPKNMLDNGKHIEENKCFCRLGVCLPEGMIDVTDCYYGFPIALSYPHFYDGEEILFSKVEGLTPNKELHETRFWIQPESGLPLDVSVKFQINMVLGDLSSINNVGKFSNTYLPMLWFDIRMYSLPTPLETKFKIYLNVLPIFQDVSVYILFIFGASIVIFTIYRLTFKIMFKSFDGKKNCNYSVGKDIWIDKNKKNDKDMIYAPCEIPLNESSTESDSSDPQFNTGKGRSLYEIHSDRLKDISHRLSDKVYDSVGGFKEKVRDITHVSNVFKNARKQSFLPKDESVINVAYKSDTDSGSDKEMNDYQAVRQTDSEDECKYLEVIDDGSEFDDPKLRFQVEDRCRKLEKLESTDNEIIHISD